MAGQDASTVASSSTAQQTPPPLTELSMDDDQRPSSQTSRSTCNSGGPLPRRVEPAPHTGVVRCLRSSPNGSFVLSGGQDGNVVLYALDDNDGGDEHPWNGSISDQPPPLIVAERHIICGGGDCPTPTTTTSTTTAATPTPSSRRGRLPTLPRRQTAAAAAPPPASSSSTNRAVTAVVWAPGGTRFGYGSHDGMVVWSESVWGVRRRSSSSSGGGVVKKKKAANTVLESVILPHRPRIYALDWATVYDDSLLAVGTDTTHVYLVSSLTHSIVATLQHFTNSTTTSENTSAVWSVRWNASGTRLASGAKDSSVTVWSARYAATTSSTVWSCLMRLGADQLGRDVVWSLEWKGKDQLITASDPTLRLWTTTTTTTTATSARPPPLSSQLPDQEWRGHEKAVTCVRLSPGGGRGWMASGSFDQTIRLWDVVSGVCGHVLPASQVIATLDFVGGAWLWSSTASSSGQIHAWPLEDCEQLQRERQALAECRVGHRPQPVALSHVYIQQGLTWTGELLGTGAFGTTVYRVKDTTRNWDFALKTLYYNPTLEEQHPAQYRPQQRHYNNREDMIRRRFENELTIVACSNNDNIIRLFGYHVSQSIEHLLLFEYAEKGSLASFFSADADPDKRAELTSHRRLHVAVGAAKAIHYLHAGRPNGEVIFHRDIKSANFCLTADYTCKLIDCGLGKLVQDDKPASTYSSESTISGVFGSPGYICPQYLTGQGLHPFQAACDIYSFGIVLMELMTGCLQGQDIHFNAFLRDARLEPVPNGDELLVQHLDAVAWVEAHHHRIVAKLLVPLALKACAWAPEQRPTAEEMVVELMAIHSLLTFSTAVENGDDDQQQQPQDPTTTTTATTGSSSLFRFFSSSS